MDSTCHAAAATESLQSFVARAPVPRASTALKAKLLPAALESSLLQEHPELLPLIQRKFRLAGDVDTAQRLVFDSRGLQRARELAAQHASLAVRAVRLLRSVSIYGISFSC